MGSCATMTLITPTHIYCANLGDSRTIISENGQLKVLTTDHKPMNQIENERIVAAGGRVMNNRVKGKLAVSRAIGDFMYKDEEAEP